MRKGGVILQEIQTLPGDSCTFIYKCPYGGEKCVGHKHCHVLETPEKLAEKMAVVIECPVRHKAKIRVEIGA